MSNHNKATIPSELRWAVWERDNFTCQICRRRQYLAIDHIIPESKGGKTEKDNLQTLCKSCNSGKYNKTNATPPFSFNLRPINCELLNVADDTNEAARLLGIGYATLYRWIKNGKLIPLRISGRTFIPQSEIDRLNEKAAS